ncbi:MAG: mechanosensitive ion channel family protein [Candidatus Korobacteraceae bacterium]
MVPLSSSRRRIVIPALLFSWLLLASAVPLGALQTTSSPEQAKGGYPVIVEGQEILRIYQSLGSFSAQERADGASERLRKLIYVSPAELANLNVSDSPYGTAIRNGDDVLLIVTDEDARYAHLSREVLAKYYVGRIQKAIGGIRQQHGTKSLILAAVYGVLTLAAYLGLIWLVVLGSRRLLRKLESAAARMKGVKIQQSEILAGNRIAALVAGTVRLLRLILLFVLTWIFLATEFNYFPWTRQHGRQLLNYILTPIKFIGQALLNYLPNLFYIFVIVTVIYYVLKFIRVLAKEFESGNIRISGFYPEWIQPTYKIIRFLLFAFTAVIIYPYLPGENSPAFKGVGLFIGVLISLGSTSAVANVVAGVILTYTRGFRVGDWVKIGDTMGEVTAQTMLATHVKTIKNEEIIIPNSVILSSHITNYSLLAQSDGLILHTSVTIGYDEPWRKVYGLLIEAALKTEYILNHPAPFVLQNALDDSYVEYEINAYTNNPLEMVNIYSALRANIQDCFYAGGVEIMSPAYSALRDGNKTAIPAEYLPKDYRPQGFRIARDDAAAAASGGKE